jgi:hypothetical protein
LRLHGGRRLCRTTTTHAPSRTPEHDIGLRIEGYVKVFE